MNQQSATTDATNVLPVTNYGTDYYHISYRPADYEDGYAAIAMTNGTIVYEGGAQVATLNAGQVYHRYYATNVDGTGAHITSNNPIALFVVNLGIRVPQGISYTDRVFQQMVPVNSWGNNFLVPVTAQGRGRIRIMASQNGTVITQSGGEIKTGLGAASLNLNAGQFVELEDSLAGGGCFISANKPVGVTAYMMGGQYSYLSYKWGDPALGWVPPIEQKVEATIIAPFAGYGSTQLNEHYALVVTATATRAQTTVAVGAGAPTALSGGTWIAGAGAAGSAYSFYSMPLSNITASYRFSNPEGLTVMGYGMGSAESYLYLSGAAGRSLNPAFYINEIHYQDIDGNVVCGQTSFHVRGVAQFQVSAASGYLKWYVNNVEETSHRDQYEWDKTLAPGTYTFRMEIIDNNNQTHTLTTTFTVKNQAVAATITTAGTTICYNSTATLTGSSIAGVTSPVYRWYSSQTATTPLYTGPTYTTPALTATTTYYVSVEGSNYCENVINTRKAVTVTASSNLTPGSIGTAQSICYNTAPQMLTEITAAGGGTYQWQSSANNSDWANINDATSATYSPPALTASAYYRRAVTSGSCGTVYSASVLITVYPVVTVNAVSDTTVCAGTVVPQKTFSSPIAGVTYTWTNNNTAIGLAASGTGNQPQFTAAQVTQAVTATITVTPVYNGCAGTSRTYTITVNSCTVPVNPHIRSRVGN
jgi:hypothetical protein